MTLKECLRPPKFYGTIGAVVLTSIENPVTTILESTTSKINNNGRKTGGGVLNDLIDSDRHPEALAYGFKYEFPVSSSSGFKGVYAGILVYTTRYLQPNDTTLIKKTGAATLRRLNTIPQLLSDDSADEYIQQSKDRAEAIYRKNILNPLSGGLPESSSKKKLLCKMQHSICSEL